LSFLLSASSFFLYAFFCYFLSHISIKSIAGDLIPRIGRVDKKGSPLEGLLMTVNEILDALGLIEKNVLVGRWMNVLYF
jgi:hypothetical protein